MIGHFPNHEVVSFRNRSISFFGMSRWRSARDGRSSPRAMSRRTLFSQIPSISAVSLTLNATREVKEPTGSSEGSRTLGEWFRVAGDPVPNGSALGWGNVPVFGVFIPDLS